ncbi:MAG: hypothetical protein L7F77_03500, partial [Candidatus Magnetominusculus sp. LBB02]|nr:hypothetical protein [Candidatus Magnetominusculus sp. LBB02]
LAASYLKNRGNPFIWYHIDETDIDAATFFYYMSLAVSNLPGNKIELPAFTPEYFNNVHGFATRYFKELFAGLKHTGSRAPFVVVFDNYQNLPADSVVHYIIARNLFLLPDACKAIIISRAEPPIEYADLKRNDGLGKVEWNDLLFTLSDTFKLVKQSANSDMPEEQVRQLYKKMDGWAVGLTLAIERTGIAIPSFETVGDNEAVFDYFASEILEQTEQVERECLLKTAYLKEFTLPMAVQLTGCDQTHKILSRKHRQFFLTQKHTDSGLMFQYHDLFHDFLRTHAKDYFNERRELEIARLAVDILEESGQFEAAAQLCIDMSDIERLSSLMVKNTAAMIAAGRGAILNKWFSGIPDDFIENKPWLLYWRGMSILQSNPAEARKSLEPAYTTFKSNDDPEGLFSAFCSNVDTYLYQWKDFSLLDNWIYEFQAMAKRYNIAQSLDETASLTPAVSDKLRDRLTISIFSSLIFRQPNHPAISYWEGQALQILRNSQNIEQLMSLGYTICMYYLWSGRTYKAGVVIDILSPVVEKSQGHILSRMMFLRTKALYLCYAALYKQSQQLIDESLEIGEKYDIHLLDKILYNLSIYNSLSVGNIDLAEQYLKKMEYMITGVHNYAQYLYHHLASLVFVSREDYSSAIEHMELAIQLVSESGSYWVSGIYTYMLAYVLIEAAEYDKARQIIKELNNFQTAQEPNLFFSYVCAMEEALIALNENDEGQFIEKITNGISHSKTMGMRLLAWQQKTVKRLCVAAIERNIEPEFIKEFIRDHEITPGDIRQESWPYPIRVYTLGRFAILKDDKPIKFSAKTQKKPLELLKAVIAAGGRNVSVMQLSDTLWPEADGDAAAVSYRTNLHRLRKLLGDDYDTIQSSDNNISINSDYCWVDLWALQEIMDEFRQLLAAPDGENRIYELFRKAQSLYKGAFLHADQDQPLAAHRAEQLKDDFASFCCKAGTFFEGMSNWEKGIECYKSAIEADNLREECYRKTIMFYMRAGLKADAVNLYNRCKQVFETQLGVSPSQEMEKLIKQPFKP